MTTLDYTPLNREVKFQERMRHKDAWQFISAVCITLLFVVVAVCMLLMEAHALAIALVVVIMLVPAMMAWQLYYDIGKKIYLQDFARNNGMTFTAEIDRSYRPGVLFDRGSDQYFSNVLSSDQHSFKEIGTFTFSVQRGKNTHTYNRGYVRLKLPRRLPNIVLDAKSNDVVGRSDVSGISGQQLSLEGDFDKHFTLYAPEQYATDALYIFTPDIMQLLIDSAHKYDCEIIDDDFYIHSEQPFDLIKQSEFEEIHAITAKLKEKLERQTDYYADSRVEGSRQSNVVAPEGARIKQKRSYLKLIRLTLSAVGGVCMYFLMVVYLR